MSSIAQKLCDDLVEPVLKPSSEVHKPTNSTSQSIKPIISSVHRGGVTRSIIVEKKKIVNKLNTKDSCKPEVTRLHSKETIYKKNFRDTSVNTRLTGPFRNGGNSLSSVKKNYSCSCKNISRKTGQKASKFVQTLNEKFCMHYDKACSHYVETMNCGTQFFNPSITLSKLNTRSTGNKNSKSIISNNIITHGKRWAVSRYPARGPDF